MIILKDFNIFRSKFNKSKIRLITSSNNNTKYMALNKLNRLISIL